MQHGKGQAFWEDENSPRMKGIVLIPPSCFFIGASSMPLCADSATLCSTSIVTTVRIFIQRCEIQQHLQKYKNLQKLRLGVQVEGNNWKTIANAQTHHCTTMIWMFMWYFVYCSWHQLCHGAIDVCHLLFGRWVRCCFCASKSHAESWAFLGLEQQIFKYHLVLWAIETSLYLLNSSDFAQGWW